MPGLLKNITLLLCCLCIGFGLADCALSVRIIWRVAHDQGVADLERKRVDQRVVDVVWFAGVALFALGFWQVL